MQQEDIRLFDVLKILWDGKKVISIILAVFLCFSIIVNFIIIKPTYQAVSLINFSSESKQSNILSNTEFLKGDAFLKKFLEHFQIPVNDQNLSLYRKNITFEAVTDSNLVRVTVKGTDNKQITSMANLLAYSLGNREEINERSEMITKNNTRILEIQNNLAIMESQLTETQKQLDNTPDKIITKKTVADSAAVIANKSVELNDEEINQVHSDLKKELADVNIQIEKLQKEKQLLEAASETNKTIITELEQILQASNDEISKRTIPVLKIVQISNANVPVEPVAPNKVLNTIIFLILGVIVAFTVVFVRNYLHQINQATSK